MSSDVVLKVNNVGKRYEIYEAPHHRLFQTLFHGRKQFYKEFWALRDVSFEVKRGECLGIIGRNGSGKSTLLQIIAGTLSPTLGEAEVNGRVSAILELGSGFNPEFTGRENIYMSGAIMGLSKAEMDKKFDKIAAFADIGEFIEQPVKIYSSGMYVRLAFAAAINVDPDIIIVDEALAVGDVRFQQKCLRKLKNFRDDGRTVLFVTHDTGAVINLCSHAIWLDSGQAHQRGEPQEVVKRYLAFMAYDSTTFTASSAESTKIDPLEDAKAEEKVIWENISKCDYFGEGGAKIKTIAFYTDVSAGKATVLRGGEKVTFRILIEVYSEILTPGVGLRLNDEYGNHIFSITTYEDDFKIKTLVPGDTIDLKFRFTFPRIRDGRYTLTTAICDGDQSQNIQHHYVHDAYIVQVENKEFRHKFGYVVIDKANYDIIYQ